jgi:hypothetical protein
MCRLSLVSLRRKSYARLYDSEMSEQKITHFSDKPTSRGLGIESANPATYSPAWTELRFQFSKANRAMRFRHYFDSVLLPRELAVDCFA